MIHEDEWVGRWNARYKKLVAESRVNQLTGSQAADFINNGMAKYCEEIIIEAKRSYYSSGEPIMSDSYYDKIEDRLRKLNPNSSILEKVGT